VLGKAQRFKKLAIFGTMGGYERKVEGLSLWGRRDRVREGLGCCTKRKWKFRERGRKVSGFYFFLNCRGVACVILTFVI